MTATIIIGICLLAVVAAIIKKLIKDKLAGKSSCGGNCSSCGSGCKAFDTSEKIKNVKIK